jgi:hypothetical protein
MSDDEGDAEVSRQERAHQRRRDRKRETRMVVDNAGIRRLLPAVRRKSETARRRRDASDPEKPG